jgi:methionyl-tRNA formyltransferase
MNLVFVGSSQFGLRCLQLCLKLPNIAVAGVVTSPQSFSISYRPEGVTNVLHADVATFAQSQRIPARVLKQTMNEQGLFDTVSNWKPDAFLVAGWYHMIPRKWRKLAPAYGLHASLLPDYSGGAPLVWAIINGESKTGITLFQMDDGVDSGPIAGQKEESIFPDDTIATLYSRIQERGLELLQEVLPLLANGTLKLQVQNEAKRRIVPQRNPENGWIDWNQSATAIDRFIRAQTRPYPGAYSSMHGKPLHLWRASVNKTIADSVPSGTVTCVNDNRYLVSCGEGSIELIEVGFDDQIYVRDGLFPLLLKGGQILGESRDCLRNPSS